MTKTNGVTSWFSTRTQEASPKVTLMHVQYVGTKTASREPLPTPTEALTTNVQQVVSLNTLGTHVFKSMFNNWLHEPEGMLVSLQSRVVKLEDSLTHCGNKVPHYCNI